MCFGRRQQPPPPVPTPAPVAMKKVKKVKNPALAKRSTSRRRGGMKSLVINRTAPEGGFAGSGSNTKTYTS